MENEQTAELDSFARQRLVREAFENMKAGDKLFFTNGWGAVSEVEVERVTKTLIILNNGIRLNKKDGSDTKPNPFNRNFYKPKLPHIIAEMEEKVANQKLTARKNAAFEKLSAKKGSAFTAAQMDAFEAFLATLPA